MSAVGEEIISFVERKRVLPFSEVYGYVHAKHPEYTKELVLEEINDTKVLIIDGDKVTIEDDIIPQENPNYFVASNPVDWEEIGKTAADYIDEKFDGVAPVKEVLKFLRSKYTLPDSYVSKPYSDSVMAAQIAKGTESSDVKVYQTDINPKTKEEVRALTEGWLVTVPEGGTVPETRATKGGVAKPAPTVAVAAPKPKPKVEVRKEPLKPIPAGPIVPLKPYPKAIAETIPKSSEYIARNVKGKKDTDILKGAFANRKNVLLQGPPGSGKGLPIDAMIPTPDGWTTMGDIKVGDTIIAPDGKDTKVTFVTPVMYDHKCYEIEFSDGSKVVADGDHLWVTESCADRIRQQELTERWKERKGLKRKSGELSISRVSGKKHECITYLPETNGVRNTEVIKNTLYYGESGYRKLNHAVRVTKPYEGEEKQLPIEPYVLGAWLGDGNSCGGGITNNDIGVIEEIRKYHDVKEYKPYTKDGRVRGRTWGIQGLTTKLRINNLKNNKHIPQTYLRASYTQRLELLQGLMDTDGYADKYKGNCEFTTTNPILMNNFMELVSTFGIKATSVEGEAKLNGRITGPKWRIGFMTDIPVFKLKRKLDRQKIKDMRGTHKLRYIVSVNEVSSVPVKCIQVDSPSHCYLTGKNFIPTHNTTALSDLAFQLKLPYKRVELHGGVEVSDLIGGYVPATMSDITEASLSPKERESAEKTGLMWQDGVLTMMVRHGGIFVADEINAMPRDLAMKLHGLLDKERRLIIPERMGGENIPAHELFMFCASMNPDVSGVRPLGEGLKDRFDIVLDYGYDMRIEELLIPDKRLREFAKKMRDSYKKTVYTIVSTRMMLQFMDNMEMFGREVAKEILVNKFDTADERKTVSESFTMTMGW